MYEMLYLLVIGLWGLLFAYGTWYVLKAKTFQPLTLDDLALIWKLHKQQTGCDASRIHSLIKRDGQVVGFQCNCGYRYMQRRLITQRMPLEPNRLFPLTRGSGSSEIKDSLQDLNIPYSHIQEV